MSVIIKKILSKKRGSGSGISRSAKRNYKCPECNGWLQIYNNCTEVGFYEEVAECINCGYCETT